MFQIDPTRTLLLHMLISLASVLWLSACSYCDLRARRIPNWLTLPALPLAILAAYLLRPSAERPGEYLFRLLLLILPIFMAWQQQLLGGADLKVLLVLGLLNPWLLIAAWAGVVLYYFALVILHSQHLPRFAGVPGFALGAGLFCLGQLVLSISQQLAAG